MALKVLTTIFAIRSNKRKIRTIQSKDTIKRDDLRSSFDQSVNLMDNTNDVSKSSLKTWITPATNV